jgi:asparagine synthase (glutamine-hydrolysing)
MCGIVGSYHFDSSKQVASLAVSLEALNKRGPDARNEVTFGNRCALGHARLSIIDTSHAADQPMYDATGRYCIVFNGSQGV